VINERKRLFVSAVALLTNMPDQRAIRQLSRHQYVLATSELEELSDVEERRRIQLVKERAARTGVELGALLNDDRRRPSSTVRRRGFQPDRP